jgi:predicted nucleotidyltransferase component of viral defense system
MAAPSAQTLQRIADETGHQTGTLEKVMRLLDLLQEIAHDSVLAERRVLKGGTALNVFHLGLDRLSVDIDLNYVGALDRTVMEAERPTVDAALNRLLVSQGCGIRRQPDEHAGGKWIGRYASALGGNGTLEVDVNYMASEPLFGATRMNSVPLGDMQARDVLVLDIHEIVAGKLVALIDRHAARSLRCPSNPVDRRTGWSRTKAAVLALGASGRWDWRTMSFDAIKGDPREFRQKLAIYRPRDRFAGKGDVDAWVGEPSHSAGNGLLSSSSGQRTRASFSTAFWIAARSMLVCSTSRPKYACELALCRCSPGSANAFANIDNWNARLNGVTNGVVCKIAHNLDPAPKATERIDRIVDVLNWWGHLSHPTAPPPGSGFTRVINEVRQPGEGSQLDAISHGIGTSSVKPKRLGAGGRKNRRNARRLSLQFCARR